MSKPLETWRPIPGYKGYAVSDLGNVKALPKAIRDPDGRIRNYKERPLKPRRVTGNEYLAVDLYPGDGGKKRMFFIHQLVMLAFVGEPPPSHEVLHRDGNKYNNCKGNLRYGTSKENSKDCIEHGTIARGKDLPQTKLTEEKVLAIFKDKRSNTEVSEEYGISKRHVNAIRSGRYWGWLTGGQPAK